MGVVVIARTLLIAALLTAMAAGPSAGGTPGFNISWDGCADGRATMQRCYICDGHADAPFVFQGSFRPAISISDFAGAVSIIMVYPRDGSGNELPIPDFWKIGGGECAYASRTLTTPTTSGGCDTTSIYGPDTFGGWVADYPAGVSRVEVRIEWATTATTGRPIVAGHLYPSFAMSIDADAAIVAGCSGCATRAQIEIQSVEVYGFALENEVIATADVQSWVLWQDAVGYPCLSTPTRNATWGAIKSMYR